jgi:hypothetical protein
MPSSALVAKKLSDNQWWLTCFVFFTMGGGNGSVAPLTPSKVSLLIRTYSDFIPENNCKPVFFIMSNVFKFCLFYCV